MIPANPSSRLAPVRCTRCRRVVLLLAAVFLAACGAPEEDSGASGEPRHVRLALNWFPEAEHGGYYAAQLHGDYATAGFDLEILGGGPDAPVIQRVATGRVTFGLTNADGVVNARAAGAPVVALFAPYQTSPRCIVVHAATGITRIQDLTHVTLALSQRPAFGHYLRHRFDWQHLTIVPYHGSVTPFLHDPRYAMQGYVFSEPVVARRLGADVRALLVAETGFNPYASVLIATETTIQRRPELVAAVVAASQRGWARYLEAPAPTNAHIHELNPEMDLDILAAGAELSAPLVLDPVARAHGIGTMELARWQRLLEQMVEAGVTPAGKVDASACYSTRFLPR